MTNETDSFVQEVDESLRQDRVLQFFKRYGLHILGGFAAIIIGVAGWMFWQNQQREAARAQSDEFVAALNMARDGNLEGAKAEFERMSSEGPQAYRVMSLMQRAAILQGEGDLEASIAMFDEAAEAARDPLMRQTAQLRAAYIAADTQDFAALQTRLQPLVDAEGRISYLARELLAIEAWEAGENDLARRTLETLTLAFDAPQEVQQRAQLALAVLGPAPEAPADGATPAPAPSEGETP